MIVSSDLINDVDEGISSPVRTPLEDITSYIQNLVGYIDIWKDPFYLHKKKCLPSYPPPYTSPRERSIFYRTIPLSKEKIAGPSFTDDRMRNLIIDDADTLLELLSECHQDARIHPKYPMIQVTEYSTGLGVLLARKFIRYT